MNYFKLQFKLGFTFNVLTTTVAVLNHFNLFFKLNIFFSYKIKHEHLKFSQRGVNQLNLLCNDQVEILNWF